jgi:hypothetical protein
LLAETIAAGSESVDSVVSNAPRAAQLQRLAV